MKGICKYIPFAIAAFVSLHSCSREAVPEAPEAVRTVSVGFSFGTDTKAAEMPAADFEDVLYSTDIFFFDAETGKRLYSQHNSTAPLKVLSGHYHVYALANLDGGKGLVRDHGVAEPHVRMASGGRGRSFVCRPGFSEQGH